MRSFAAWPFWALLMLLFACEPQEAVEVKAETTSAESTDGGDPCEGSGVPACLAPGQWITTGPDITEASAKKMLEERGYFVTRGAEILDRPAGFPEQDEFPLVPRKQSEFSEKDGGAAMAACKAITRRELEAIGALDDWYKPVYRYCRHRIMNSSRAWQLGWQVKSKVDGSPIHDRDRPSARYFYDIAVKTGRMNPKVCPHHRVPELFVEHPPENLELAKNYEERFKTKLDPAKKARWLSSSHAYEQFGARGPVDWNAYHGFKAIGGCYPFTAFDRTDVAVTALVRRSIRICAQYGCDNVSTITYIKPHWNEAI